MYKIAGALAALMAFSTVLRAEAAEAFKDGVRVGLAAQSAMGNGVDFDPPCAFADSLPLAGVPYLNARTNMVFTKGNPGLLDACSNFGVTGFSPPNFLAFNCGTVNRGGTVPKLPLEITFRAPVSRVTLKVGGSAPAQASLTAVSADGAVLTSSSVVLSSAMKWLAVSQGAAVIKKVRVAGPCVMILDDIYALP